MIYVNWKLEQIKYYKLDEEVNQVQIDEVINKFRYSFIYTSEATEDIDIVLGKKIKKHQEKNTNSKNIYFNVDEKEVIDALNKHNPNNDLKHGYLFYPIRKIKIKTEDFFLYECPNGTFDVWFRDQVLATLMIKDLLIYDGINNYELNKQHPYYNTCNQLSRVFWDLYS